MYVFSGKAKKSQQRLLQTKMQALTCVISGKALKSFFFFFFVRPLIFDIPTQFHCCARQLHSEVKHFKDLCKAHLRQFWMVAPASSTRRTNVHTYTHFQLDGHTSKFEDLKPPQKVMHLVTIATKKQSKFKRALNSHAAC